MSKLLLLAAGATGYVLGARAGRDRYDQIMDQAQRFRANPKVQQATADAQHVARERAPVVGEKLSGAAKRTAGAVQSKVGSSSADKASDNPHVAGPQGDLP